MTMWEKLMRRLGWLKDPPATPDPPAPPPKRPLPEEERDVSYGPDPSQTLDIYRPKGMFEGDTAPVMDMTHGGGWQNDKGDKANHGVIENKRNHYLALGYIVVSGNYPLWPNVSVAMEADSIARKLAFVQTQVAGADPTRITEIGHSAGANLVAQVGASFALQNANGCMPADRIVLLDGVYDIPKAIKAAQITGDPRKIALYEPFGDDPTVWRMDSPTYTVSGPMPPVFIAYSTNEGPGRETQARDFAAAIVRNGGPTPVVKGYPYSHADMDANVGLDNPLTRDIDAFLGV